MLPGRRNVLIRRWFCCYRRYILQSVSSRDLAYNKSTYLTSGSKERMKLHCHLCVQRKIGLGVRVSSSLSQLCYMTMKSHLKVSALYFPHGLDEGYTSPTQLTDCCDDDQKTDLKPFENTRIISQK